MKKSAKLKQVAKLIGDLVESGELESSVLSDVRKLQKALQRRDFKRVSEAIDAICMLLLKMKL